jgi:hypothetical protein
MIVPGGGIALDGDRWASARPAFLLPVRVLGALFRRLFLARLMALHSAGRLGFFGTIAHLVERRAFLRHLSPVRKKRWVVYAKPPFAGPEAVLAYLARYTHRVAISSRRLVRFDEDGVTLRYKDYRRVGADRQQVMTLSTDEFIRRFLLHALPRGFHRIRHYGLLAGATARPISSTPADCLRSHHRPRTTHLSTRQIPDRCARAAAAIWSSSSASRAGINRAPRHPSSAHPEDQRRDPARLVPDRPRSDFAPGNGEGCEDPSHKRTPVTQNRTVRI